VCVCCVCVYVCRVCALWAPYAYTSMFLLMLYLCFHSMLYLCFTYAILVAGAIGSMPRLLKSMSAYVPTRHTSTAHTSGLLKSMSAYVPTEQRAYL
jgi:hypothetical protein